ncbi:gluconate 2-dehydrogenase subunit 3 family protein [Cumulibacter manganitolerans]|uniref:gluconate 2-dehydrogenase subunit 3 family protein n=1 Tax=Cumulibacter manganitolerans TaxID=1884992 RepID=UPI0012966717|nr:gluconate 2-dehydrogenase subunit 3 family protein [Cumulibacter manganitolerans]
MPYRSGREHAVTPQHRGRFPGFDVLDSVDVWDDVTAGVVLARLSRPGALSFFTPTEVAVAAPLLDLLLAQDGEPRVPVLPLIDNRLAVGETDGWHYDDLPEDGQAWRETLAALDADAHARGGRRFAELARPAQAGLVQSVQDHAQAGRSWHGFDASHVWSLWTRYACTAFYSHPWAWNEIGFPGPAYPRGYLNPGVDARERWEQRDRHDVDPAAFAARVERARAEHAGLLREDGDR